MAIILSFVTAWLLAAIVVTVYSVCSSQFWFAGRRRIRTAAATLGRLARIQIDKSAAARVRRGTAAIS
jgi:hypothetical protein